MVVSQKIKELDASLAEKNASLIAAAKLLLAAKMDPEDISVNLSIPLDIILKFINS